MAVASSFSSCGAVTGWNVQYVLLSATWIVPPTCTVMVLPLSAKVSCTVFGAVLGLAVVDWDGGPAGAEFPAAALVADDGVVDAQPAAVASAHNVMRTARRGTRALGGPDV